MQKKLIALTVAGLTVSPVFAQSSIQIYGRVDASYIHRTHDAKAALQDEESGNRLGLLGEEDLGGGLKAFFQLEERFKLDTGANKNSLRWDDKSWVGLRSNMLGEVMLGRVVSVLDTIYGGGFEAFGGDTIGQFAGSTSTLSTGNSRRAKGESRINNGLRYTSPAFGGVKLIAHYGLTEAQTGSQQTKVPYGVALTGAWGAAAAGIGWQKDAVDSVSGAAKPYKTWLVDGSYDFGAVKLVAGYARSKGYDTFDGVSSTNDFSHARMVSYQVGAVVPVGPGSIRAALGRSHERNASGDILPTYTHAGVGYWHGLSKRTTLMANVSYDKQRDAFADAEDRQLGVQLGLRHDF